MNDPTPNLIAAASDAILLLTMIVFAYQAREMAKQSRESATATRASVYQAITQQMLEIDRLFIDKPALRPYIYERVPLPAQEPTRTQVLALAELFVDFFDNFVTQSGHIPAELYEPWRNYACSIMQSSPGVCHFWHENRGWYSELLRQMLDPVSTPPGTSSVQEEAAAEWAKVGELAAE